MPFLHTRYSVVQRVSLLLLLLSVLFGLTGPAQASSFLVSWNPPASAPDGSIDYYVYVSTVPDSFDDFGRVFVDDGESVVIDLPCQAETAYYFAVQSVDADGSTSPLSTPMHPVLAAGPGPGWSNSDVARLYPFEENATELSSFSAFDGTSQTRGLRIACGDVLGLGEDQVIVAPGPGYHGPEIRVFHADGTPVENGSFHAFLYNAVGATVCCGDLDGDGVDEIIVGAGPGKSFQPGVRVFNYSSGNFNANTQLDFYAYPRDQGFGVNVACGDLDGDGRDEIITGCGPGANLCARIRAFTMDNGTIKPLTGLDFIAYDADTRGVNVACGDVDGDGYDEIITGPGPALHCHADVRVFDVDGLDIAAAGPAFRAFPLPHFGVQVAVANVDDDCFEEIITAPGPSQRYPGAVRWFSLATGSAELCGQIDAFSGTSDDAYGAVLAVGMLTP